ncbi:3'-5' exonuclease [Armatimonas sp.]|uniref:3'-5' exonuclease n=1 Tax=Armatimonas sp. TaxID=1872638 RepID=UPI00286CAFBA|nr:3'-5' exonuclease [Armatimonas sp.]
MRHVIFDIEATSWEEQVSPEKTEILEIGAVELSSASTEAAVSSEFGMLVRPVGTPVLSRYCLRSTGLTQFEVDQADPFPLVFAQFLAWLGSSPFTLCTWGDYDLAQLRRDAKRHHVALPTDFESALNLKSAFSRWQNLPPTGLGPALRHLKLSRSGQAHRAPDDARSIARIARILLPTLDQSPRYTR